MKYDEIINLPHYEPKYHKRMSKSQRAAQFSPFSALTGYDEMVKEIEKRFLLKYATQLEI